MNKCTKITVNAKCVDEGVCIEYNSGLIWCYVDRRIGMTKSGLYFKIQ